MAQAKKNEIKAGYPDHYWLALGEMAEAETELISEAPVLAERIRLARKTWEADPAARIDILSLIKEIAVATGLQARVDEALRNETQTKEE